MSLFSTKSEESKGSTKWISKQQKGALSELSSLINNYINQNGSAANIEATAQDYRDVCTMAGVDPDAVRERMLAEMPKPVEPAPAVVDLMARLRALQRVKAA